MDINDLLDNIILRAYDRPGTGTTRDHGHTRGKHWCHDIPSQYRQGIYALDGPDIRLVPMIRQPLRVHCKGFPAYTIYPVVRRLRSHQNPTQTRWHSFVRPEFDLNRIFTISFVLELRTMDYQSARTVSILGPTAPRCSYYPGDTSLSLKTVPWKW
ncbi:hypothetical protein M405DRAFT_904581 [Rhizopogon salebrosus TDB-379]|nr:hypothetical protein M405DRAFT_904581 [Rhizopogon salebrosus TDB-379]